MISKNAANKVHAEVIRVNNLNGALTSDANEN